MVDIGTAALTRLLVAVKAEGWLLIPAGEGFPPSQWRPLQTVMTGLRACSHDAEQLRYILSFYGTAFAVPFRRHLPIARLRLESD
jgi:hypothetical protein